MLVGKQVRVRVVKNQLRPQYLDDTNEGLLQQAERVIAVYRQSQGRTRGELAEALADVCGEGPTLVLQQGLAKLCEDRCTFEVEAEQNPEELRLAVFAEASRQRQAAVSEGVPFDRSEVLRQVGQTYSLAAEQLDAALFADLKDEQRLLTFNAVAAVDLLRRYNVALAQAVLLRSTGVEITIHGETPARYRQLFHAIKFHRLIVTITPLGQKGYRLELSGPLSLFSATQKYGLQLALFLPVLLHCKAFTLQATVRWGPERTERTFALSSTDGLRSHVRDLGQVVPRELSLFEENFRKLAKGWTIRTDAEPMALDGVTWVPDFVITHPASGHAVFIEIFGFWRKVDVLAIHQRMMRCLPGQFVLVFSDSQRADETTDMSEEPGCYRYKRTPSVAEVVRIAEAQRKLSHV